MPGRRGSAHPRRHPHSIVPSLPAADRIEAPGPAEQQGAEAQAPRQAPYFDWCDLGAHKGAGVWQAACTAAWQVARAAQQSSSGGLRPCLPAEGTQTGEWREGV